MASQPSHISDALREHAVNPRHRGPLSRANGIGSDENPVCGDEVTIRIRVDRGIIEAAAFDARGCAASTAAASILTGMVSGSTLAEAQNLRPEDVEGALGGLPAGKQHSAVVAVRALRGAVADYLNRQAGSHE